MPYSRITLLPSQQVIVVEEGETILDDNDLLRRQESAARIRHYRLRSP